MPCPLCSIKKRKEKKRKSLSQLIKLHPQSSLKSQMVHCKHKISNPTLIHLLSSSFILSRPHMDAFHLFSLGGPQHPCVPALWLPPGKWVPRLSFPSRAFCTFNHVTLSRADYRHLSSLEKVRAGIRASWGIRSPNWFQLSVPSNDQFFSRIDGATGLYVRMGRSFLSLSLSPLCFLEPLRWTAPT